MTRRKRRDIAFLYELEPHQAKALREQAGYNNQQLKAIDDVLFICRWLVDHTLTLHAFSIHELHCSSRFKNNSKQRVNTAINLLDHMNITGRPITIPHENGRPGKHLLLKGQFHPLTDEQRKVWQQLVVDSLIPVGQTTSQDASQ
jgi:hypothetical protein